jgi:CheY-like chemotaxis protein
MNSPYQASPALTPDIFVLCDEAVITAFIFEIFRRRGYRARPFHRGEISLLIEEFRAANPRPRILLAKRMGGEGVDAAQACREIEPGLKVIVLSGYLSQNTAEFSPSLHQQVQRELKEGPMIADALLPSPFSPEQLLATVDSLFGAPR